jgi:hypothetical protein
VCLPALLALLAFGTGTAAAHPSPPGADAGSAAWTGHRAALKVRVPGLLYPGAPPRPIRVRVKNRSAHPIRITRVSVDVRATGSPDCPTAWFRTKPARRKRGVLLRGKSRIRLPAQGMRAPTIAMIESGTNQDACQGTRLMLMAQARSKRARVALAASSEQEGQLVGPALRVLLPVAAVLLLGARLLSDRRARRTSAAASSSGNEGRR